MRRRPPPLEKLTLYLLKDRSTPETALRNSDQLSGHVMLPIHTTKETLFIKAPPAHEPGWQLTGLAVLPRGPCPRWPSQSFGWAFKAPIVSWAALGLHNQRCRLLACSARAARQLGRHLKEHQGLQHRSRA